MTGFDYLTLEPFEKGIIIAVVSRRMPESEKVAPVKVPAISN